jgi:hypothetical protein
MTATTGNDDNDLLPETPYTYTVTMRDKLENTGIASTPAK